MNCFECIGRLTADPELSHTPSGVAVARFSVAVDRRHKDKDGNYPTDFISMEAWRNTAEFVCRNFCKGQQIGIAGTLQTGSYTDKDGIRRKSYKIVVNSVTFCGSAPARPEDTPEQAAPSQSQLPPLPDESSMPGYEQTGMDGCDFYTPDDDDLPF